MTQRRTMQDFAHQMRWLVDEAYPGIPVVRVVLDNLKHPPHSVAVRDLSSPPRPGGSQSGWSSHYPPKHGSWLNMAEIEFSVLSRSCLRQRLPDEETLERRSPGPGAGTQRRPIRHQLAVQHPRCPNQTPPPLSLRFQN